MPGELDFDGSEPDGGYQPHHIGDGYTEAPGDVGEDGSAVAEVGGVLVDEGRYSDDGYDAYPDEDEGDDGDDEDDGYDS